MHVTFTSGNNDNNNNKYPDWCLFSHGNVYLFTHLFYAKSNKHSYICKD